MAQYEPVCEAIANARGLKGENYWIFESFNHDQMYNQRNEPLDGRASMAYLSFPSLKSQESVCVVLHGLRRSPVANRRLSGEAARSGGICHLLGEYMVAWPSWSQC